MSPTLGNINVIGTGSITVAGNPGTSTLTAQLTGLTNHNVLVGAGTATITSVAPGATGSVLTSTGAASDPSFQAIPFSKMPWSVIGANQTLVLNNGYFCTTGGALSLALPAVSGVGDTIEVALDGSTSWTITQPNAATRIRIGNQQTTLGVGGSLASTDQGDWIELVCETANARWSCAVKSGNITVV